MMMHHGGVFIWKSSKWLLPLTQDGSFVMRHLQILMVLAVVLAAYFLPTATYGEEGEKQDQLGSLIDHYLLNKPREKTEDKENTTVARPSHRHSATSYRPFNIFGDINWDRGIFSLDGQFINSDLRVRPRNGATITESSFRDTGFRYGATIGYGFHPNFDMSFSGRRGTQERTFVGAGTSTDFHQVVNEGILRSNLHGEFGFDSMKWLTLSPGLKMITSIEQEDVRNNKDKPKNRPNFAPIARLGMGFALSNELTLTVTPQALFRYTANQGGDDAWEVGGTVGLHTQMFDFTVGGFYGRKDEDSMSSDATRTAILAAGRFPRDNDILFYGGRSAVNLYMSNNLYLQFQADIMGIRRRLFDSQFSQRGVIQKYTLSIGWSW